MRGAFLVFRKEVLELLRDRRTLFFTLFVPVVLYPLVFLVVAGLGQRDEAQRQDRPSRVALADPARVLEPRLREDERFFLVTEVGPAELRSALQERRLELAVEVEAEAARKLAAQEPFEIRVRVDATEPAGELALERLKQAVRSLDMERVQARLASLRAPAGLAEPSRITVTDVAEPGLAARKALGAFLPCLLMLMMFQGAMQHGIHVTAGEKERGTLQTLLATRLERAQIIQGKLAYIFLMGVVAAVLNLASLGLTLGLVMGRAGAAAPALAPLAGPGTLLLSFLLLVPLGLLFSSFILFMGIRARNTAEAGTSLMPGLVLIILLGAVSLAPGLERMAFLPYVPILNVSLAIRNLFAHQSSTLHYLVALVMTAGLSAAMTWASARLLDREAVLFHQG